MRVVRIAALQCPRSRCLSFLEESEAFFAAVDINVLDDVDNAIPQRRRLHHSTLAVNFTDALGRKVAWR